MNNKIIKYYINYIDPNKVLFKTTGINELQFISTCESLEDICPIAWNKDVLNGQRKVVIK